MSASSAALTEYLKKTPPAQVDGAFVAYLASLGQVASVLPDVAASIVRELADQRNNLKLIASENYCSLPTQLAMGNLLIVTTPKDNAGIATVDISNPTAPLILDSESPSEKSYVGGFYGHHAYLLNPIRMYDVLSDPTAIKQVSGTRVGGYFEYMSFQDGFMFAGRIRPEPGATKINVKDPARHTFVRDIYGRRNLQENDDQFTVAIGNLLVMSDDNFRPTQHMVFVWLRIEQETGTRN